MTVTGHIRLSDFAGVWTLARVIRDNRARSTAEFSGTARFTEAAEGLVYAESGQLRLAGHAPIHAERRYLWQADGDRIAVLFEDGRPFHDFAPNAPDAAHWCDPDTYRVQYDFGAWPVWQSVWQVSGPRKDYEMTSTYHREAE